MLKAGKRIVKNILNRYIVYLCKREFDTQTIRFNERAVEYAFVFQKLAMLYPQTVLDVGTGTTALPHLMRRCGCLVTAIDNRDHWTEGMVNRHYYVINDDITNTHLPPESYDFITCVSTLEHIKDADSAVRNMFALLKPGGHIVLTFPYNEQKEYVENVYELPGSTYGKGRPYITQSFSRRELDRWITENSAEVVDQEYWQFWDGDYLTVGEQIIPPIRSTRDGKHQLTCILLRKR